jgi:hypothetical protein
VSTIDWTLYGRTDWAIARLFRRHHNGRLNAIYSCPLLDDEQCAALIALCANLQ